MRKRFWLFLFGLFGLITAAAAETASNKVQISLVSDQQSVQAGAPFTVGILLKIEKGWHTYHKDPGDAGAPPDFEWILPSGFRIGEVQFPKPLKLVEPGNIRVNGYKDEVLFWAKVIPPKTLMRSEVPIHVQANWLVCEKVCIPESGKASIVLPVSKTPPLAANKELFARYQKGGMTPPPAAAPVAAAAKQPQPPSAKMPEQNGGPLFKWLFFAFVGGLILNIMPCVLPVISLKVLGFVRMAHENKKRVLVLGMSFVTGILASFVVLAGFVAVLKTIGQEIGWGFQFQYPGFVIVMTAVVFGLGLSLMGVFELSLAAPKKGMKLAQRETPGGAFFQGILATVLATPCTAPLLGVALGFAFAASIPTLILVFLVMGLGMASPYILLSANPAWMKFIPKPGPWTENFKQAMAFLLFGTGVWLLWVLGRQVGVDGMVWTLAFLVVLAVAAWLYGKVQYGAPMKRAIWIFSLLIALILAGNYCFKPMFRMTPGADPSEAQAAKPGIAWKKYNPAELERLLASGSPVFLDFTADWCLTCKVNEKLVLSQPEVVSAFEQKGIVGIKLDWTNQNKDVSAKLKSFGRYGVPLYVYYPEGNRKPPVILPEVLTTGGLLETIRPQPKIEGKKDEAAKK